MVAIGTAVGQGEPLLTLAPAPGAMATVGADDEAAAADAVAARADLAAVSDRHERTRDDHRTDAVARRHGAGRRTARENIADLVDAGSFLEYGPLVVAAQRGRRSLEELIERTPADGLVGGVGTVDGRSVVAMSYDYTVLAGTQGLLGHEKKDRLFELAERRRLPVVFFTEGGGGRPGDTDGLAVSGLDTPRVPLVRTAQRVGPTDRHRVGILLRRKCRDSRLLRRRHRRRRYEHRDGRPGDDRRWWPRHVRADRDRAVRRAGGQRCHRHRRRRRRRCGEGGEAVPLVLHRGRGGLVLWRPGPAAPSRAREPLACVRRPCRDRRDVRPRGPCSSSAGVGHRES